MPESLEVAAPEPTPAAAQPKSEYVVPLERRGWVWTLFLLAVVATVGFAAVLFGEVNNYSDDPGTWAGLPTSLYALAVTGFLLLVALLYLLLLIRREVPARTYPLHGAPDGSPAEAAPAPTDPQAPGPTEPSPETPTTPEGTGGETSPGAGQT